MKNILRCCMFLFLLVMIQSTFAAKIDNESPNFVSLSDLHFNPFDSCMSTTPCPLLEELRQASVKKWESILSRYQTSPSSYGADVNYPLLKQSLDNISKKVTNKTHFVLVMGDLLGHNFDEYFAKYSSDQSTEAYKAFVHKTMEFMTDELKLAIPNQDIFIALGNNDSNTGDNTYDPTQQFYRETAFTWGALIHGPNARAAMLRSFPTAGYYAVDVPRQPNLRLIILNSVILAGKSQGAGINQAAQAELNWLDNELNTHHKKTLIILHIPDGVDVYTTVKSTSGEPVEFWQPHYTQQFLTALHHHAADIVGILAGHFHTDWFQVAEGIPVVGVPALSPIFGNNPGFKVFTYSPASLNLQDYATYYNPINTQAGWQPEYDFNAIYQPACHDNCRIVDGMNLLQKTGPLADQYQQFFSVGTNSQPITKNQKWLPFYWCAIHAVTGSDYKNCINSQ